MQCEIVFFSADAWGPSVTGSIQASHPFSPDAILSGSQWSGDRRNWRKTLKGCPRHKDHESLAFVDAELSRSFSTE